jgi:putative nucleotidyltransferase with HDIG domain
MRFRLELKPSIKLKMAAVIFLLLAFVTVSSALIVMKIMDQFILNALVKKGVSMGRSAATVAGYHLLSGDLLALDNLASKFKADQEDVIYLAIVDSDGTVRAHSTLDETGGAFESPDGIPYESLDDGSAVVKVSDGGYPHFAFRVPIMFANREVGAVFLALGTQTLVESQQIARDKITLVAVLFMILGTLGVAALSTMFTTPIKRLSEGVSRLSTDNYGEAIRVTSHDELGQLTRNFNEMAAIITEQKSQLKQSTLKIEQSYVATIRLLSTAIDARDNYTLGHSARVSNLSSIIGRNLNLGADDLADLEVAAMFHDVGKIRTPDSIIKKTTALTDSEYEEMMKHTINGAEILHVAESLHKFIPAVKHHHEWFNGSGYPDGLREDNIPLHASIISITDAFDAMTSSRPYRSALEKENALERIIEGRGVQFDPRITDAFIEVLQDYEVLARPEVMFT